MASQGDRFRRRALSRGYKVDEVDAFLDRVEATLSGEPMGTPVPSQEVDDVVFRVRFGGYDEWQVDVYLDRVARQLGELEDRGVLGRAPSPEFASGPGRDEPRDDIPVRDGPPPMRDSPPMRDGPPPMRDSPPMRDGPPPQGGMPMRPGDDHTMPAREPSPPMRGDMSPVRHMSPARDMPMRDEPSTPPPPTRRPEPPAPPPPPRGGGRGRQGPAIEDDGEGFGHLRADDDEGFGHLAPPDEGFDRDDPFADVPPRRNTPPSGFDRRDDDRFDGPPPGDRGPGRPPEERFEPVDAGPPGRPPDGPRFGPPGGPPPDRRPMQGDSFSPPRDDRTAPMMMPQNGDGPGSGGGFMGSPPAASPGRWGNEPTPPGGFDRGGNPAGREHAHEEDMTRPLRRPPGPPPPGPDPEEADSNMTQRLRRGGGDRFLSPPPPPRAPMGRDEWDREPPPPREPGFGPGDATPPHGMPVDHDHPMAAGPPPGGRPTAPFTPAPQEYREPEPAMRPRGGGFAERGDAQADYGRRNPYDGRGVFDEPGRHGRDEMTTEMRGAEGPFTPDDLRRLEQLRSAFQPRRFGSGYDPGQVDRVFDAMSANMTGRVPQPITDKELDTSQFSLVQRGYFEAEVDAALREMRAIFAQRGMVR